MYYNPKYDQYEGLSPWARRTLDYHGRDKRPYVYSRDQLEKAATHDPYWNAAQEEMVRTGKMHGYMRMYWGKKILEWSKTPKEAFEAALYLNNKYEIDGRDPNGYAGVAWCLGQHDRAWAERPVFGKVRYMNAAGLELYAGGVIYMRDEGQVRRAFEYAKEAGMRIIVGVPNHDLLPLVETMVKQYNIAVAIHNHGPSDKVYPTPESAYELIKNLDRRIGLCIDIGHTMRSGIDPSEPVERYADRLLDLHVKDVSAPTAQGSTVEMGRGIIDLPRLFRTLIKTGYAGIASFEHEKDDSDPMPGVAESIGYARGILATL